ncbi:MAG: hypothetical protein JWO87_3631 [Phycisphaerales bacterium]|nr:hypothetical protein [Phycisphaerales bacterium]
MQSGARFAMGVAFVGAAAAFSPCAGAHVTYSNPFDAVGTGYAQVDGPVYIAVGASGHVFVAEGPGGSAAVLTAAAVDGAQLLNRRSESVAFVRRIDGSASLLLGGAAPFARNDNWMGRDILGAQRGALANGYGMGDGARFVTPGSVLQACYTVYPTIRGGTPLARMHAVVVEGGPAGSGQSKVIESRTPAADQDGEGRAFRFQRSLSDNPNAGQAVAESLSTAAASTMMLELGGLVPAGQQGHFAVAGSAALNAALEVIVDRRLHPSLEDNFSVEEERVALATDVFGDSILPAHENKPGFVALEAGPRPAPEPAGLGLFGVAVAGLLSRRKR